MHENAAVYTFEGDPLHRDLLKSLHYFAYSSAKIICRLRAHLNSLRSGPRNSPTLEQFEEGLESLAQGAEAWGFEDICRVAKRLKQVLLDLETGTQTMDSRVAQLFGEGLDMLATLLANCESEYLRRNSVVKLLDSLSHTGNRM